MSAAASTAALIGGIVLEGMKMLNEGRQHRLNKKHGKAIKRLHDAENGHYPSYTDAELMKAEEELEDFLLAFKTELVQQNAEAKDA